MLNVANWTDKQLDELSDLLRSADFSPVAQFICQNFIAKGSRILTDSINGDLRFTVGADPKTVVMSPGIFQHGGYISQVDSSQVINILDTASGSWGIGQVSDPTDRWDIVCVKWNEQLHTVEKRWFVNDTVVPNTYYQQDVNTLINKAYYDIAVVHGTPGLGVPDAPAGFWTICEILIPGGSSVIDPNNIYDTAHSHGSWHVPPNWVVNTRIMRLEYFGGAVFVAKTRLPFHQAAAPVGWIQDVTLNDRALRVVSGAGGGYGGSTPVSSGIGVTSTGGHALTIPEMPSHYHTYYPPWYNPRASGGTRTRAFYDLVALQNTGYTGGLYDGGPAAQHTHPLTINYAVAYVDVIICIKA